MKVIFLQNTLFDGRRYVAGESADVPDAVAKQMAEALLVHVEQSVVDLTEEPAKAPPKRVARKAAAK